MNIKNNVDLTVSEAVELLAKIADSLEANGEFAFDLKGQEVSIEAGDLLNAVLSIKPKEFSIVFNWEESAVEQDKEEEQTFYEPPKMVREVNLPDETVSKPQMHMEEPIAASTPPRRALPDRMPLNTTTLPYDAGYWAPAFTSNTEAQWTLFEIDSELENKKWGSDEQITSLSDLTPDSAKPKTKRTRAKSDDDLFSELDNLDSEPKPTTKSSTTKPKKVEPAQNRPSARPAAKVGSIPSPSADRSSSIPNSTPSSSSSSSSNIPRPNSSRSTPTSSNIPKTSSSETAWKEPSREDNATSDDWVKPSQVLKKKGTAAGGDPKQSIPSPSSQRSSQPSQRTQQNKSGTIPSPTAQRSSANAKNDPVDEVREWKEPSREENITDDDWIKPSEFLKKSGQGKQEQKPKDSAINRPPPTAPDAKKKSDKDDDKKKGWASWD